MKFEIDLRGRIRSVSIEPAGDTNARGGSFRVVVDGEPHMLSVVRTDLGLAATLADGRLIDAAVTLQGTAGWLVQTARASLVASIDARRHASGGDAAVAGEQRITAPMPGRIVRVLARTGDEVAAGQGLVVVEAMKMENELVSPKAGRIKDMAVAEGQSIEAGRLLVIVE